MIEEVSGGGVQGGKSESNKIMVRIRWREGIYGDCAFNLLCGIREGIHGSGKRSLEEGWLGFPKHLVKKKEEVRIRKAT